MHISIRKFRILFICFICQALIISLCVANRSGFWLGVALSLWMYMFAYLCITPSENIELMMFLVCFALFILGGQIALNFLGYDYPAIFDSSVEIHTNLLIVLSLISIFTGFLLIKTTTKQKRYFTENPKFISSSTYTLTRKVSRIIFYFTAIFWFAMIIEQGIYTQNSGYYSLYADFSSRLPYLARVLGNFAPVSFYVFLATRPSIRESRLPIVIYIIYLIISLATGRRIYIAVGAIMLLAYFVIRNHESGECWIGKRALISLCIAVPLFIIFLQFYGQFRFRNGDSTSANIGQTLINFIGSQGYTVNIIKYEQVYSDALGSGKFYSFYNLIRFLRTSRLTSWFMPDYNFQYGAYTIENAVNGNSFANSLTYIISPNSFLRGGGTGSCYIAELFHDFGYCGVILGNFAYGILFGLMPKMRHHGIVTMTLDFVILECMLRVPRYNFDYALSELLSVSNWLIILAFVLFIYLLKSRLCVKHETYNSTVASTNKEIQKKQRI